MQSLAFDSLNARRIVEIAGSPFRPVIFRENPVNEFLIVRVMVAVFIFLWVQVEVAELWEKREAIFSTIFPLALGGGNLRNAAVFGDSRGDDAEEGDEGGEHGGGFLSFKINLSSLHALDFRPRKSKYSLGQRLGFHRQSAHALGPIYNFTRWNHLKKSVADRL